jgi:hypothetical protein
MRMTRLHCNNQHVSQDNSVTRVKPPRRFAEKVPLLNKSFVHYLYMRGTHLMCNSTYLTYQGSPHEVWETVVETTIRGLSTQNEYIYRTKGNLRGNCYRHSLYIPVIPARVQSWVFVSSLPSQVYLFYFFVFYVTTLSVIQVRLLVVNDRISVKHELEMMGKNAVGD